MKNKFVKRSSAFIVGMALSASMVCAPSAGIFGNIAPDTAIVASAVSTVSRISGKAVPSCNSGKLDSKCIDVSYCQCDGNKKPIDWKAVKESGIDYAIIRCGANLRYKGYDLEQDDYFMKNYKEAKQAGIAVGVYFYSDATSEQEGAEEARKTIEILKKAAKIEIGRYTNGTIKYAGKPELPVYIDYEALPGTHIYNMRERGYNQTEICIEFCEILKKAGYKSGVYTSSGCYKGSHDEVWLNNWIRDLADEGYSIWTADWCNSAPSDLKDLVEVDGEWWYYHGRYDIWQCSIESVPGIDGPVDVDVYYHDLDVPKGLDVKRIGADRCFTWHAVLGADKYEVYRDDKLVATVKSNSYNETLPIITGNETVKKNNYYVKAVAENSSGQTIRSAASSPLKNVDTHESVDAISDLKCTYNSDSTGAVTGATLSWSKSKNANLYRVLRYDESLKKWVKVKDVTGTKATVNITSKATKYCVKPCYTDKSKVLCGTGSNRVVVSNLSMKNPSVSYTGTYLRNTGAKFSWSAIDGCTYEVEIVSPDGSTRSVPVTAGHSKTISFEQTGIYKVRVRAVNGKAHGKWSGYTEVIAHAISPTNARVTGAVPGEDETKGVATCTWTASNLADGYIISCENKTTGDIQEIKIESPDETTCTFNVDAGCKYVITTYSYAIINGVEEKATVPATTNYTAPAVFE